MQQYTKTGRFFYLSTFRRKFSIQIQITIVIETLTTIRKNAAKSLFIELLLALVRLDNTGINNVTCQPGRLSCKLIYQFAYL